jgi:uncharacterized membrane protein (DUF2068 family)
LRQAPAGVRAVAVFEAAKGALVILLGFGLIRAMLGHDAQAVAEGLVRHLHLDAERPVGHLFVVALEHLSNGPLLTYAALALLYVLVRFAEAFGLWFEMPWAIWLAALSGSIYLPFEIAEFVKRPGSLKLAVIVINVAIVAYMVARIIHRRRGGDGPPS